MRATSIFGLGLGLVLACNSPLDSKRCTLAGCGDQGVRVDFSFREVGSYLFEVTVDGVRTTCQATIPLPPSASQPCDRSEVILTMVGSQLPPEQQSIGGLSIPTADDAKTVQVRATRDGVLLGDETFPITYQVTPGPNGPDCEPKECRSAVVTFP